MVGSLTKNVRGLSLVSQLISMGSSGQFSCLLEKCGGRCHFIEAKLGLSYRLRNEANKGQNFKGKSTRNNCREHNEKRNEGKSRIPTVSRVRPDTHQPWTLNLFLEPINQWFVSAWLWDCEISTVVFQKARA